MAHWLEKYRGCEIEVLYLTDANYRDRGVLVDLGDGWIELHKRGANTDTLLIPETAIRFARPLDRPVTAPNALLRPVEQPPDVIEVDENPS